MNFFSTATRRDSPLVLGHRGARHAAVENTLSAFQLAQAEGADGTELDIVLSKDHQPVVFHDSTLTRMTGGLNRARLSELRGEEIARIRLPGDHRIPTLREVLDWAKQEQQLLNVELKTENARTDRVAEVVSDAFAAYPDVADWVLVSSFHPQLLHRFVQAEQQKPRQKRVPCGFLFTQHHAQIAASSIPEQIGACALHPEATLIADGWKPAQALPFNTWTVNDPSVARNARSAGARAIITDCPEKIRQGLR